jgi:hypothetical protein
VNIFKIISLLFILSLQPAYGCDEDCSLLGATACTDITCKACDTTGFSVCVSCCSFDTQGECPSECTWHTGSGQCRDEAGTSCDGIPETPQAGRPWLILGFLMAGFALSGAYGYRKSRQKPSGKN